MGDALWLTMAAMTTVGYGDTVPRSLACHVIVTVLFTSSLHFMAIQLDIIGNVFSCFSCVWESRERLLLLQRTRDRLTQWGYTAEVFPKLIDIFGQTLH